MHTMSFSIHQHLDFDVSSTFQVTLQVDTIVVEGFSYLVLCHRKDPLKLVSAFDQANATSATTGGSFEHQGEANLLCSLCRFSEGAQNSCPRQDRQSGVCHCFTC